MGGVPPQSLSESESVMSAQCGIFLGNNTLALVVVATLLAVNNVCFRVSAFILFTI